MLYFFFPRYRPAIAARMCFEYRERNIIDSRVPGFIMHFIADGFHAAGCLPAHYHSVIFRVDFAATAKLSASTPSLANGLFVPPKQSRTRLRLPFFSSLFSFLFLLSPRSHSQIPDSPTIREFVESKSVTEFNNRDNPVTWPRNGDN